MQNFLFEDINILIQKSFYKRLLGDRVIDAIYHFPARVQNRTHIKNFSNTSENTLITFKALVIQHTPPFTKRQPYKIKCLSENNEEITLLFFHFRKEFLKHIAPIKQLTIVSGLLERRSNKWIIMHPEHIGPLNTLDNWVGNENIYPSTSGATQKALRFIINKALQKIPDLKEWIYDSTLSMYDWQSWKTSILNIHNMNEELYIISKNRLIYDELFAHQVNFFLSKKKAENIPSHPLQPKTNQLQEKFIKNLPFSLTPDQAKAFKEISSHIALPKQMIRLLQGDVGSGKTLVALLASIQAIEAFSQVAFLVPIDVLARQHEKTAKTLFDPLNIKSTLLTSQEKGKKRKEILEKIKNGDVDLVIGTHALLEEHVSFNKLGLIIIDEQHRFGVEQRLCLSQKGFSPHILSMSATPIPRTLSLAHYGDMDISTLYNKPKGRKPIITRALPIDKVDEVIKALKRAISEKNKIYWICPLIEESELMNLTAVKKRFEYLLKHFKNRVVLIHGQMKHIEKEKSMEMFINDKADILVATTVIEVGIDISSATIIVIENSERFGLTQLHQLRGRVGRANTQSTCLLLYQKPLSKIAQKRLMIMRNVEDGFEIANFDLKLRGSGDIFGIRQSGDAQFKLAVPKNNSECDFFTELLKRATYDAKRLIECDPDLTSDRGKAAQVLLKIFYNTENSYLYKLSG
ncbi:MAG: ATP-dependent DNA helicase RecG [Alphaproteobacteria bacterium]